MSKYLREVAKGAIYGSLSAMAGLVCALILGSVMIGCTPRQPKASIPPATVVVTGCDLFRPITASPKDTSDTKTQIIAHNYAYQLACANPKPSPKKA